MTGENENLYLDIVGGPVVGLLTQAVSERVSGLG